MERFNSQPEETRIVILFITLERQLNSGTERQRRADTQIKEDSFIVAAVVSVRGMVMNTAASIL